VVQTVATRFRMFCCSYFSQGVDTTDARKTSVTIPLSEIPFVVRAMGFYPSEQEVNNKLNSYYNLY